MREPKIEFQRKFGLSEIIAGLALILSAVAIWQSSIARNDSRILNKLDFRPILALHAQLERINDKIPAHINIRNKGPVDAVQVRIQFYFHRYLPATREIKVSATGSDVRWAIERLPALKHVNIKIDERLLNNLLPVFSDGEKHYRILEIRLNYRRDADLREYSESAFYFVSQEGKWVGEDSSALNDEIYTPIKEAAFGHFVDPRLDMLDMSDTLHEISE